ncbi:hypothetical protein [Flavobacterium anhuiense]|uniref:hypothetical protein n=1 Tax=Flavobacterium anhuiense TaxID=459526 RepID=UPI003D95734C
MEIIITYDIPSKHREFKDKMKSLGYKDSIPGTKNCKIIYFPNTTLYHPNKTAENARDEAKTLAKELGVSLERCISTIWNDWAAVCGEPFK